MWDNKTKLYFNIKKKVWFTNKVAYKDSNCPLQKRIYDRFGLYYQPITSALIPLLTGWLCPPAKFGTVYYSGAN